MKYFIVLLFILTAASSQAQITLEHLYTFGEQRQFSFITVDSGITKYLDFNRKDSIYLYNLDHTLDRVIIIPQSYRLRFPSVDNISKKLFNTDDGYEYLIESNIGSINPTLRLIKENGDSLWGCDYCNLHNYNLASIFNSDRGTKMLIDQGGPDSVPVKVAVYSLPGKLPGGTAKSGVNSPSIVSGNSLPISAYPNPSNGQMRISYKLPLGVATGELVILSTDGVEVKRYRVGDGFNDILVEKSDLPSGSYFYKLVTDKGESETQKLIILK